MTYPSPLPDPGTDTTRRYVITTRADDEGRCARYLDLLHGNFIHRPDGDQAEFISDLKHDAEQISDAELTFLLQIDGRPEWRKRLTAAWLIGLSQRTQFRDSIGELLLESRVCFSGQGYCVALAAFGTQRDAELLIGYLDHYLPQVDLRYDQDWALGALMHLDTSLGTHHADRYLASEGLWETWNNRYPSSQIDPASYQHLIATAVGL
ncbi:DUF6000 family protein [Polymorphospora rubra]|uniref:Uncharacterized protein n=1 Tax=Polymorphospora rubra TaxID=338584 RepID=A0A810N1Q5_9ACTN|nr:DUF6000 family protein [Polymorphospora rubra]BCJ65693.1 hypothetical protein Prubr_27140 [Polymorphospora rubra]